MSRVAQSTSSKLFRSAGRSGLLARVLTGALLSGALLTSCTTATSKLQAKYKVGVPAMGVYIAKYEEVEAAIKQAMIKYPQRVDNTEAGIFETDYVKGESRFRSAHSDEEFSSGYRYRILIRLARGKAKGKPAVKVQVLKNIEIVRDFFSEPEQLASDGIEDDIILYRIGREIDIAKAILRASENGNAAPIR